MGVTTATGWVKLLIQPFNPFVRIPLTSINTILISAKAIVTFISLVGGFIPNMPMIFASPIYNRMVEMYVEYSLAFSPSMDIVKSSSHMTILSATICFLPGLWTLSPRVNQAESKTSIAMTTHVMTTDSLIAKGPIVNAVSTFNWSSSSFVNSSIAPPFKIIKKRQK